MSEAIQQAASVPAQPAPLRPFEKPDSGADYLATEEHYRSLAGRIAAALRRGCRFALITGEPPPDPPLLSAALATRAADSYAVLCVPRGSESSFEQVLRAVLGHFGEQPQLVPSKLPLLVLGEGDNLADEQFDALFGVLISTDQKKAAAALSGSPALLTRLQALKPTMFDGGAAATFGLQELGREEIEAFVLRQLHATDSKASVFTPEAIGAVADFSGGDPALVNRLSRLMIELADPAEGTRKEKPVDGADSAKPPVVDSTLQSADILGVAQHKGRQIRNFGKLTTPSNRRRIFRMLLVAVVLCGAAGGLFVKADDFFSLVRFAQQEITAFTTPDLEFRGQTELQHLAGATLPKMSAPAPEAADQPSPLVTEVVPPTTSPILSAEGTSTDAMSSPAANAAGPPPDQEQSSSSAAATPEFAGIPEHDALAPGQTPSTAAVPPLEPRLPAPETAALVARGDAFVRMRDIASARLFYERAFEMGDGRAALRMGATFDPVFLERVGIRGARGDEQEAPSWYRRARDLGNAEADRLLQNLKPH